MFGLSLVLSDCLVYGSGFLIRLVYICGGLVVDGQNGIHELEVSERRGFIV